MDMGTLGAISTVLVFIAFIGICWWAFAPKRKKRFEDAANLPFAEDDKKEQGPDTQNAQTEDEQGGSGPADDVEGRK